MLIRTMPKVFLSGLLVLGLWACAGREWRIQDAQGQAQALQDIRFEPADRMEFRVGNSRKWLEANQIHWLSIDPADMQTDGGRVYYSVRIRLQDGSRFPDSASTDTLGGVYIPADGLLVGSAQVGRVEIPISQLRELKLKEK